MTKGELGRWGEDMAAGHLVACGHRVLARNWRHRRCEIDLIATNGDQTIFVEVKVRSSTAWEQTEELLSSAQRRRLIHAAHAFLRSRQAMSGPPRFDIIHITRSRKGWRLDHVVDAFLPIHV